MIKRTSSAALNFLAPCVAPRQSEVTHVLVSAAHVPLLSHSTDQARLLRPGSEDGVAAGPSSFTRPSSGQRPRQSGFCCVTTHPGTG